MPYWQRWDDRRSRPKEITAMKPRIAFNLWQWIEEHRQAFEPPVGNKVIWEDSQFTAMIIRGPNARRDFVIVQGVTVIRSRRHLDVGH